jgi:hypothetical protein
VESHTHPTPNQEGTNNIYQYRTLVVGIVARNENQNITGRRNIV